MRFLTARRLALVALVPALFLFSVIPGCSNESEGQRCGDELGPDDADCADGLVCVAFQNQKVNRCCYPGGVVHDSRCLPSTDATGGAGGTAGAPATGGSSPSTGGTAGSGGSGDVAMAGAATAGAADLGGGGN